MIRPVSLNVVIGWQIAAVVNAALDDYFPESEGVQVIAEPGRFYVAAAYTLATLIHSKRDTMYYINDGVYGSFNCILYDHAVVNPIPLDVSSCPNSTSLVVLKVIGKIPLRYYESAGLKNLKQHH